MHARLTLFAGDPARHGELVDYLQNTFAPGVKREPGSRGVAALARGDLGVVVLQSLWATEEAMRESGKTVSSPQHFGRFFGATMSPQEYEVRHVVLRTPPSAGAGVRLVRLAGDEAGLAAYHDKALSSMPRLDGFCLALMFVDPGSGEAVGQTIFRDADTLAGSRGAAAAGRVEAVYGTGLAVRAVEEFVLEFSATDWA